MSKSVFVTKAEDNSFVLITYRSIKTKKLIAQIWVSSNGKYYDIDIDLPKGKQNYGVKISTEEYYEAIYSITNFAAKNNLPYTDIDALKIWQTRDAACERLLAEEVA